nr:hypothetical protein 1634Bnrm3_p104 [Cryptomonas sp.]
MIGIGYRSSTNFFSIIVLYLILILTIIHKFPIFFSLRFSFFLNTKFLFLCQNIGPSIQLGLFISEIYQDLFKCTFLIRSLCLKKINLSEYRRKKNILYIKKTINKMIKYRKKQEEGILVSKMTASAREKIFNATFTFNKKSKGGFKIHLDMKIHYEKIKNELGSRLIREIQSIEQIKNNK